MQDDFARFYGGPYGGKLMGISIWPPPEIVEMDGGKYVLQNFSKLTEEDIGDNKHIARGCEYEWSE